MSSAGPVNTVDANGWWATGDLGYLADGEIVICGRLQDAIAYDGRTIFPTDVERSAAGVNWVRPHSVVAVRVRPGGDDEYFAVVVESDVAGDEAAERFLALEVAQRVVAEVDAKPRAVIVVPPKRAEDDLGQASPVGRRLAVREPDRSACRQVNATPIVER